MADELGAPLVPRSQRAAARRKELVSGLKRPLPLARLIALVIAVILGGALLRIGLFDDPEGGRPTAEVPINSTRDTNPLAGEIARPTGPVTITADPQEYAVGPNGPMITTLDGAPVAAGPSGPQVITVPDDPGVAALPDANGVVAELAEMTEDGAIPRKAANGVTPFAAYSRPSVTPATAAGKPLIAIIVTGLGLNESGTLDAITQLPDEVTLAFAPYGKTLERTAGAARAQGHELLLEVPLEPFDYPENDPGPETLLTGQPPRANMEKLYWLMARFGGYVGLINNMGARFTSSGADFAPIMEELGARGVGYIDDGSSNRSLAPQLSSANNVPYARADILVDLNPSPEVIRAALAELEAKARAGGTAIGIATALPISIQTIAEWAKTLEERGFTLVPASALMSPAK